MVSEGVGLLVNNTAIHRTIENIKDSSLSLQKGDQKNVVEKGDLRVPAKRVGSI